MITDKKIQIVEGDLSNAEHAESFLRLTAGYMADPMGKSEPWTEEQKTNIVQDMIDHPCALILFAVSDGEFVGICTCFYAYSTFLAKPLLNIHDIYVDDKVRGKGVAKLLVQAAEEEAKKEKCGKVTLEVRKDNLNARDLYKSQGFQEAPHSMFFWIKTL